VLTIAAYAAGSGLTLRASRAGNTGRRLHTHAVNGRGPWLVVKVAMALLCINKQSDVRSLLTDLGRVLAQQQGSYKQRRVFQQCLVLGVLVGTGAAGVRRSPRCQRSGRPIVCWRLVCGTS
jgi:hypothetical protein